VSAEQNNAKTKFTFDLEFQDAAGNRMPSPEELATQAKAQGFAEGQSAGKQQAAQEYATQINTHLGQLANAIEGLTHAKQAHAQLMQEKMLKLTGDLLQSLLGHARSHYADELIQKGLTSIAQTLANQPALVLKCHPSTQQFLSAEALEKSPISGHNVTLKADPALQPGDLLAEWDTGGIDATLNTQLDDLLETLMAAKTAPTGELSEAEAQQARAPQTPEQQENIAAQGEVD
jgi:flagellar biosynthesis/type III secretory pathway protein FliH